MRVNNTSGDRRFYIEAKRSDECLCGKYKQPNYPFCYRCYKRLSREMNADLMQKLGSGYEEAFDAAAIHLSLEEERCG